MVEFCHGQVAARAKAPIMSASEANPVVLCGVAWWLIARVAAVDMPTKASIEVLILCSQARVHSVPAPAMAIAAINAVAAQDLGPMNTALIKMINGVATSTNISAK